MAGILETVCRPSAYRACRGRGVVVLSRCKSVISLTDRLCGRVVRWTGMVFKDSLQ